VKRRLCCWITCHTSASLGRSKCLTWTSVRLLAAHTPQMLRCSWRQQQLASLTQW
jgi:hypothetical protein